jgi:hypothetical protein
MLPAAFCIALGLSVLLVIGDIQAFKSGAIERQDRLLAKRLIPFFSYFDPEVDGTVTGPFYPLCPLRCLTIFDVGLKQLSAEGYFRQVKNVSFIDLGSEAFGSYSVARRLAEQRYLGIVEQGWILSGTVALAPGFTGDLLFVKPADHAAFIAATQLQQIPQRGRTGYSYHWRLFLSPFILPDPRIPLEMWVYRPQSNEFVKIQEAPERCEDSEKQGG